MSYEKLGTRAVDSFGGYRRMNASPRALEMSGDRRALRTLQGETRPRRLWRPFLVGESRDQQRYEPRKVGAQTGRRVRPSFRRAFDRLGRSDGWQRPGSRSVRFPGGDAPHHQEVVSCSHIRRVFACSRAPSRRAHPSAGGFNCRNHQRAQLDVALARSSPSLAHLSAAAGRSRVPHGNEQAPSVLSLLS